MTLVDVFTKEVRERLSRKSYTPKGSHAKSEGIAVARAIAAGDVSRAYLLASMYPYPGRTVAEARAINFACDFANAKYGASLNRLDFLYPK